MYIYIIYIYICIYIYIYIHIHVYVYTLNKKIQKLLDKSIIIVCIGVSTNPQKHHHPIF